MIIDCAIDCDWWLEPDELEALSNRAILCAARHLVENIPGSDAEVSILFTTDEHVQELNRQWRQQDKPTNVLSFAANEGAGPLTPVLGDIVLAQETILQEAKAQGKTRQDHLTHLIIHGFLHLLGYDHILEAEAREMEELETCVLAQLGIADPYGTP
ncbi:MAG: rRNA maturation RNase YbeY [Rhizobiaceae bacterium]